MNYIWARFVKAYGLQFSSYDVALDVTDADPLSTFLSPKSTYPFVVGHRTGRLEYTTESNHSWPNTLHHLPGPATRPASKSHEVLEERLRAASGKEVEKTTLEGDPSTTASQSDVGTSKSALEPAFFTSEEHAAFGASCDPEIYQSPSLGRFRRHNQPQSKSPFTLILTTQDVKSYKPAHHGFNVTLDLIQKHPDLLNDPEGKEVKAKDKVLWVAQSVFHDIIPAKELGLETVWITDREGTSMGGPKELESSATWVFNTLGKMAEAVEKE
ncbi:hypothetical protein D9758_004455 [Tetrapyrgos nigripes]|uniref:Uncharacterized protein n=1 Tax=Tetrapyrgos nigripes TaxID=182062 RepID=A0A8H5LSQ2_9AGAR|nr:hypothetical protein D9758_016399 [Tetrapyrgos nigripes]KAF5368063.1 hypothetical protein D9758_004455 [Tetrapyrgos nigripes]